MTCVCGRCYDCLAQKDGVEWSGVVGDGTWNYVWASRHRHYIARNLYEALKHVKDTGDWHGELRQWCELNMDDSYPMPNSGSGPKVRNDALS